MTATVGGKSDPKTMTKKTFPETGNVLFTLNAQDIESAIRDFICACHPEVQRGYVVDCHADSTETVTIPTVYYAKKP